MSALQNQQRERPHKSLSSTTSKNPPPLAESDHAFSVGLSHSLRITGFRNAVRGQVAYLAEALVCRAMMEFEHFVRSFEGGQNDGGLCIDDGKLEGNVADRFFCMRDGERRKFVPIDVKTVSTAGMRANVCWRYKLSPSQARICQAVVLVSPKEPGFVAFIPLEYFRSVRHYNDAITVYSKTYRPFWTLHPAPAFASEWAPFMLPATELKAVLSNTRTAANGSSQQWLNDYTGAKFMKIPPPQLFGPEVLEPGFESWRVASNGIEAIWKAFNEHATRWRLDLVAICPLLGDFKFVHNSIELFVEMKASHCTVTRGHSGHLRLVHAQESHGFTGRQIFNWKSQWDYLWTTPSARGSWKDALLLPRDSIPTEWWNAPLDANLEWLSTPSNDFEKYLVRTEDSRSLVQDVEEIFRVRELSSGATSSLKATRPVPLAPLPAKSLLETSTSVPDEDSELPGKRRHAKTWSSTHLRLGCGSPDHPGLHTSTYKMWASELLMTICRQSGQAVLLDVGRLNPRGRYYIARYIWSPAEKHRYDREGDPPRRVWQFDKRTPVISVDFLQLAWTIDGQPHFPVTIDDVHSIKGRSPSLVVCDLYPPNCMRLPHNRFVVPSTMLPDNPVTKGPIELKESALLDEFCVDTDELVGAFNGFLKGEVNAVLGCHYTPVVTTAYCSFLEDVLKEGTSGFHGSVRGTGEATDDAEDASSASEVEKAGDHPEDKEVSDDTGERQKDLDDISECK